MSWWCENSKGKIPFKFHTMRSKECMEFHDSVSDGRPGLFSMHREISLTFNVSDSVSDGRPGLFRDFLSFYAYICILTSSSHKWKNFMGVFNLIIIICSSEVKVFFKGLLVYLVSSLQSYVIYSLCAVGHIVFFSIQKSVDEEKVSRRDIWSLYRILSLYYRF